MTPSAEASTARSSVADRYRVLLDIGRTLTGTLSREDLYRAIYQETAQVLEAAGFYICLYDQERDLATIVFYADRGSDRRVDISYPGSDSEVISSGQGFLVEDRADSKVLMVVGEAQGEVTRSAISAPLRHEGKVLGAISAQSYQPRAYTAEDLELLQGIADVAAVALENARVVAALKQQREAAERIEEIGRGLTSSLDPEDVLRQVIAAVLALVPVDGAGVWLLERGSVARVAAFGGRIALPEGSEWDLGGPLYERLIVERKPFHIRDLGAFAHVPDALRSYLTGGSAIGIPMVVGTEVAGLLTVGSVEVDFFTDDETQVLLRLTSQASVALENARLHASLQALSLTDALTGLPNRRHLNIQLEREVAAARRGRGLVVCIYDLDRFKDFNDSAGHLAGDDALRAFGQILVEENRAMNLVARFGGDEFIAILSESELEGALTYVTRVEERMAEDPILGPARITASTGLAAFNPDTMNTVEDIIQAADTELYKNKGTRS